MAGDLSLLSDSYLRRGVESGVPAQEPAAPKPTSPARVTCVKSPTALSQG